MFRNEKKNPRNRENRKWKNKEHELYFFLKIE